MAIHVSIFTVLTNTEQLRYSKFYLIRVIKVKIMVTNIFIYLRIMSDTASIFTKFTSHFCVHLSYTVN